MPEGIHWKEWTREQWDNAVYCPDCGLPMMEILDDYDPNIGHYQCIYCTWIEDEKIIQKQKEHELRTALRSLLIYVDYEKDYCRVTDMVGATLPVETLRKAREILTKE